MSYMHLSAPLQSLEVNEFRDVKSLSTPSQAVLVDLYLLPADPQEACLAW